MLKTRSDRFKSMSVTAPEGGYAKNGLYLHEDTVIVTAEAIEAGDTGAGIYACDKIVLPKKTGLACKVGEKVYFDATAGKVTNTDDSAANQLIGRCLVAAGNAATEVEIDFQGDAG